MTPEQFQAKFDAFLARFEELHPRAASTRARTPEGITAFQRRRDAAQAAWGFDERFARYLAGEALEVVAPDDSAVDVEG